MSLPCVYLCVIIKQTIITFNTQHLLLFLFLLSLQNVDHKMKFRSKKGQLPFIELNGEEIADSAIIIKELSAKFDKDLDAGLTQDQRNIAHATISMIENHLVWIIFYWRTKNPDLLIKGYKVNLQHALGCRLPNSILNFFFRFTYGRKVSIKFIVSIIKFIQRCMHTS